MKILLVVALVLLATATAFAQPDPRDSVILESKTVAPASGQPYTTITVYITNKDSLTYLTLPLIARSISGGAYGILARDDNDNLSFGGVITPLTPSLRYVSASQFSRYDGSSPDTFLVGAGFDPAAGESNYTIEPPNSVRKAVWEIKFDTIRSNGIGSFQLDSTSFFFNMGPTFTNTVPQDIPTNFVKSVVRVFPPPDPRDSVIIESKVVYPGTGHPYTTVKVFITNKDTLAAMALVLKTTSTSGGAYAIVARPRGFSGVINPLGYLRYGAATGFGSYHSDSPDTFLVYGQFDPADPSTLEPPNSIRKAMWEIKFDTVLNNLGTIELDSGTYSSFGYTTEFVPANPIIDMPVNFLKGVLTVPSYRKGDLNQDVALTPSDVVWILNCVMLGMPPPAGEGACDLNCDGQNSPADVVLELNAVFLQEPFPC